MSAPLELCMSATERGGIVIISCVVILGMCNAVFLSITVLELCDYETRSFPFVFFPFL